MIVQKYISSELVKTSGSILLFLVLIVFCNRFIHELDNAVEGDFAGQLLFQVVALQLPEFFMVLVPLSLALAIMVTFSRMAQHHELEVLYASGISYADLLGMTMKMGIVVAVISAVFSLWGSPTAIATQQEIINEHKEAFLTTLLKPGQFQELPNREGILYIAKRKKGSQALEGVFAALSLDEEGTDIVFAQKGDLALAGVNEEQPQIRLIHGSAYKGQDDSGLSKTLFEALDFQLPKQSEPVRYKRRAKPTSVLMQSDDSEDKGELMWRLSVLICPLVLVLFAMRIAKPQQRKERTGHIIAMTLLVLIYFNLLALFRSWIEVGTLNFWVGLILPNLALSLLAIYLNAEVFSRKYEVKR